MNLRLSAICLFLCLLAGLCRGQSAAAPLRDSTPLHEGWQMTPLQTSGKQPPAQILDSPDPVDEAGVALPFEPVRLPAVHGFYSTAADSAFPMNKHANYWYGAVKKNVYNWAWYRYVLEEPAPQNNTRLLLAFTAVAWESRVWVNGQLAATHRGSFTGFEVDITPFLKADAPNVITVLAVSDFGEYPMRRVYGKMFSASANMGGIIGAVELRTRAAAHVQRTLVKASAKDGVLSAEDWIQNATGTVQTVQVEHTVTDAQGRVLGRSRPQAVRLEPGITRHATQMQLDTPPLWSPREPNLLTLRTQLSHSGSVFDSADSRFGVRDFEIANGNFLLNGERVRLYLGNILTYGQFDFSDPASVTSLRQWLRRQKELGVNTIRYHMGGIDSDHFLQICDEEGMLVINEWPWFHRVEWSVPEGEARETFFRNNDAEMEEWLYRDYNHPSNIILSLANEVWTAGEVPLLEHTYAQIAAKDSAGRPRITSSGFHSVIRNLPLSGEVLDFHNYSMHSDYAWGVTEDSLERDFRLLAELYPQGHGPVIISESLNVPQLPKRNLPEITAENYGEFANLQWVREIGVRALADRDAAYRRITETMGIRVLEKFRQDERLAGFSPWFGNRNALPVQIASVYGPYYIGLDGYLPHLFAGEGVELEVLAIKDTLAAQEVNARAVLSAAGGAVLAQGEAAATLEQGVDKTPVRLRLQVPEQAQGEAQLQLQLVGSDGAVLAENDYPVFLAGRQPFAATVGEGVEPLALPAAQKGSVLVGLLREAGVEPVFVNTAQDLSALGARTLVLAEGWAADSPQERAELLQWVEGGGRVFAFGNVGAVAGMEGFSVIRTARTRQNFVDLVVPEHPVFQGLSAERFEAWNGNSNLIVSSMISPLSNAALAAAGSYTPEGQMAVVMEASAGEGRVFASELDALSRYESDPIARRYVHNVLGYALGGVYGDAPRPEGSGLSRFLERTTAIPEGNFQAVSLRRFYNRPLKETMGKASALDYASLPTGKQVFLGVPFDIVAGERNDNRSVLVMQGNMLPDMPQRVEGIPVGRHVRELYFLQAAFYPNNNVMARYRIRYANGSEDEILVDGNNAGDWYHPRQMPNAFVAWSDAEADTPTVGLYLFSWENPHPELKVESIDIVSEGSEQHSSGSLILLGITSR